MIIDGIAQVIVNRTHHGRDAQRRQSDADEFQRSGPFRGGLRRLRDLLDSAGLLLRCLLGRCLLLLLRLRADVGRRGRGRLFELLRVVGQLFDQQDQTHRPRH